MRFKLTVFVKELYKSKACNQIFEAVSKIQLMSILNHVIGWLPLFMVYFFVTSDICQPGWTYFGGYCYFTSPACASWLAAESNCSAMDSDLVTVHDQEENVFIQHRHDGDKSWIGLNDRSVEGSFVWTNKEISSFRFWAPKQPNDWNNEDCVHTLGTTHRYTWNDVPCNDCFNFTCFTGVKFLAKIVVLDHELIIN